MRTVEMRALPDGRVRIHWFVFSDDGPARTTKGKIKTSMVPINLVAAKGYIACDVKRETITPSKEGEVIKLFPHTDDPRAATCPECCATKEYKAAMAAMGEGEDKAKIHWFHRDRPLYAGKEQPDTGHIACEPKRPFNPSLGSDRHHTDDPRAATCADCRSTDEYREMMMELDRLEKARTE